MEHVYKDRIGELIGIELGGPGQKLFAQMDPDKSIFDDRKKIFKKTAGFTLSRLPEHKYTSSNHEVVEADVFLRMRNRQRSWDQVLGWIKENGKPDVIIERMVGPLFMIREPKLFLLILDRWYKQLNDGGCMFIELPKKIHRIKNYDRYVARLISRLNSSLLNSGQELEVRFADGYESGSKLIYIKKGKDAPKSLIIKKRKSYENK